MRTVYQSLFFTALSSEKYLHMLIEVLQYLAPDSLQIDKSIHDTLHDLKLAAHHSNTATASSTLASDVSALAPKGSTSSPAVAAEASGGALETFLFLWQMLMMTVLAFFVISLIQHFAQYYQSTIDAVRYPSKHCTVATMCFICISCSMMMMKKCHIKSCVDHDVCNHH